MNKIFLLSTVAAMACFVCSNANAATNLQANGEAKVKIVDAVALSHTGTALNFGEAMSAEAHDITVDPSTGTVTSTANNQMVSAPADGRDEFKITGPKDKHVTLVIPTAALNLDDAGNVKVKTWTSEPAAGDVAIAEGGTIVKIGGTLGVAQGAATADYSKPYTVQVNY